MKFHVLTLFPEIPRAFFENSIMAKAVDRGLIQYNLVNIRDFAYDTHRTCDDKPYGGVLGKRVPGMLMLPEPLSFALDSVGVKPKTERDETTTGKRRVIYCTPSGKPFTQDLARQYAEQDELVFICGRYEGIDQRIIDLYVDDEVSIGDYVLSSGEVAVTVVIDAVYRLIDGVISSESLEDESHSDGLLEYPQYTRPEIFRDLSVPEVLLSGHHEKIRKWRLRKRIEKTLLFRPDLIEKARDSAVLSEEAELLLKELENGNGSDPQN
ncbi:MAG TPA: tRNA (guanosine(37)-N1)-methyltransferase TrmD [Treponemataceae bacterium]|jgi:tRNA (guanine37-N1)-methyltransferase|nr:tRNA (guanosine(37)-N1)-methyltransferase TrmD [Treponema sp.]OQB03679.1 MAG: tRNA (guanine-N(1)-)-methyltransferase [Spirochaetes bacterium ADurb.Bin215]HOS35541.1 tRNA (guanosine(37)-N1)-methyltransferase TrmD [Treponemataceae bacterium]HPA09217.1 tRNA (guanosine(37)-N1)-methyltransferase TrmD [Treponemataceae bacterium]HPL90485.1 tRNA (guanosine(37)-N1)-methyltransferase TrmD [Treponemataceae bacterium]